MWRPKNWKIPIIGCNEGADETCYEDGYEVGADAILRAAKAELEPLMAEAIDISDWSFVQQFIRDLEGD